MILTNDSRVCIIVPQFYILSFLRCKPFCGPSFEWCNVVLCSLLWRRRSSAVLSGRGRPAPRRGVNCLHVLMQPLAAQHVAHRAEGSYSLGIAIGIRRPSQDGSIAIAIPIAIASRFQCPRRSSAASGKPMPNALISESFTAVQMHI